MSQPSGKVWFITGASSGFGRSMVALALERGNSVVATARRTHPLEDLITRYSSTQLLVLHADVTKPEEVKVAFSRAKDVFGRIDVVYNNAGQLIVGEVESVPIEMARGLFEVNFWGVVNVSIEAIRFFREDNPEGMGGTLLQMSSRVSQVAVPVFGFYCASKWAVEGFTESLMKEVDPCWNIKFAIVEPGWHATNIIEHTVTPRTPVHPAYVDSPSMLMRAEVNAKHQDSALQDTDKATAALYEFMQLEDRPLRLPLGKDTLGDVRERNEHWLKNYQFCERFSDDLLRDSFKFEHLKEVVEA
ncbi:NAD(P)-binding protein [Imleria badia]|nr:NAD(P)-binding protein [Imleria badia]